MEKHERSPNCWISTVVRYENGSTVETVTYFEQKHTQVFTLSQYTFVVSKPQSGEQRWRLMTAVDCPKFSLKPDEFRICISNIDLHGFSVPNSIEWCEIWLTFQRFYKQKSAENEQTPFAPSSLSSLSTNSRCLPADDAQSAQLLRAPDGEQPIDSRVINRIHEYPHMINHR